MSKVVKSTKKAVSKKPWTDAERDQFREKSNAWSNIVLSIYNQNLSEPDRVEAIRVAYYKYIGEKLPPKEKKKPFSISLW